MKQKRWKVDPSLYFLTGLRQMQGFTLGEKAIALYITAYEDQRRKAPTLKDIEKDLGISRDTIERAMPRLREAGLVVEA